MRKIIHGTQIDDKVVVPGRDYVSDLSSARYSLLYKVAEPTSVTLSGMSHLTITTANARYIIRFI